MFNQPDRRLRLSGQELRSTARTAIVVESMPLLRSGLIQLLESELSLTVVEVITDADQILPAQRALRPTLAVIDRDLPGRDVFQVLRLCKRSATGTLLILLASHLSDVDIDRALATGVSGFALKSDDLDELTEAIRTALEGRLGATPRVAARLNVHSDQARNGSDATSLLARLTERELEILAHVTRGMTIKETAELLGVSPRTVETHKSKIMGKLQIHNRALLTLFAVREGLIPALPGGRSRSASVPHARDTGRRLGPGQTI
jgi:DNA-binding NarL/FixJ family response regulator